MNWTDSTTYSQKDKARIPTSWLAETPMLTIEITRGYIYTPGKWMVQCSHAGLQMSAMKISDDASPEMAQKMAESLVRRRLEKMLSSLTA